jgi:hypothetical protein
MREANHLLDAQVRRRCSFRLWSRRRLRFDPRRRWNIRFLEHEGRGGRREGENTGRSRVLLSSLNGTAQLPFSGLANPFPGGIPSREPRPGSDVGRDRFEPKGLTAFACVPRTAGVAVRW